jgi:hypothetical protein
MRKQYEKPQFNNKGQKQCTKCKVYKDISDYHKYSKSIDGYKHYCKSCVKDYDFEEYGDKRIFTPLIKTDTDKQCRRCEKMYPMKEYNRPNSKYFHSYCNKCSNQLGTARNIMRKGITVEEYAKLEKAQNGVCKICKNPESRRKRLSIDHDHNCCPNEVACGKCIRGLICFRCNSALGMIKDDIATLQSMIFYLSKK